MNLIEANIDGLVGPTHNYAGLAYGNEAAQTNAGEPSNPKLAALQGLRKMRLLMELGIPQLVMPPHPRPNLPFLRALGFTGDIRACMEQVARQAPALLPYCYSASAMWAANAATVAPSSDTADARVHFTPANLAATAHRAVEPAFTARSLRRIFAHSRYFVHHDPLPPSLLLADEGAANHMCLQGESGGVHIFVYGREQASLTQHTARYPARQALAASQAVARLHGLSPERTLFVRQTPAAIDAGVFHNDVIATSHDHLLLYHEQAFAEGEAPVEALRRIAGDICTIRVSTQELALADAVKTYLFNSQIVTVPTGMVLIAPAECAEHPAARRVIERIRAAEDNPIREVHFMELRESMRNGGGPACLRLRMPLTADELAAVHSGIVLTDTLYGHLATWVERHYRDRLPPSDLADPALAEEAHAALKALEPILDLAGLYDID